MASSQEQPLVASGYIVAVARAGHEAMAMAFSGRLELTVRHLGPADNDGTEILAELRSRDKTLPAVILTAKNTVVDSVAESESGVDDCVGEPLGFVGLLARIRVRLRDMGEEEVAPLRVRDAALELGTRLAYVAGRRIELSPREHSLAEFFFRHPGQALSRQEILSHVWGYDYGRGSNVVDVYVGYLRKKLGRRRIESVRGVGYRMPTEGEG